MQGLVAVDVPSTERGRTLLGNRMLGKQQNATFFPSRSTPVPLPHGVTWSLPCDREDVRNLLVFGVYKARIITGQAVSLIFAT